MQHLIGNNLIKDTQHGFMPGKSCATNLTFFMDKVTRAVDEGKAVDIIYLDFAKAFDKVPRQRLLNKLRAKGVDVNIVKKTGSKTGCPTATKGSASRERNQRTAVLTQGSHRELS
jgi:hypothetical protein